MTERLRFIREHIYPAVFALLPVCMDTLEARALMTAIGLQESRFQHRRQMAGGPARGFWQFEKAGIRGVLNHSSSQIYIVRVLEALGYPSYVDSSYQAVEHNDVLAAAYARLLLWTHSGAIPGKGQYDAAWDYYIECWRPGKPHRETWNACFDEAWS